MSLLSVETTTLTEQTCEDCGDTFVSDDAQGIPDPKSMRVERRLVEFNNACRVNLLDTDFIGTAPHPLCPDCFIGWLHNVLRISDDEDEEQPRKKSGSKRVQTKPQTHPKHAEILALFERPHQFLNYLFSLPMAAMDDERVAPDTRQDDAIYNLLTAYVQEKIGGSTRTGQVTEQGSHGIGWYEPDQPPIVLDDAAAVFYYLPGPLHRSGPVYKVQRALAEYVEQFTEK